MPHSTGDDTVPPLAGLDTEELCRLLEGSTEGTWIFEPDIDRVAWSPKIFALLGYDEQRERFDDIDQIIHPDDRDDHRAAVERVMAEGGRYGVSVRIRCQDGRYKGIGVHGLLLPSRPGAGRRLVGFLLDATAELDAKASLARSEAQFRAFMDNCPAGVYLKRLEGPHVYVNEASARIIGLPIDEIVGRSTAEVFPPEAAHALTEADREALRSPGPISKSEHLVGSDGTSRHIIDTKFSVPDVGSDSRLIGGFGLDITDRIRHEEEIRQLDRRIQESQRLDSIGMLAGGVAHDFNNILLTVMGNVELALDEKDAQSRAALLRAALDRCRRATALCTQLLVYAGKSPSAPRALDPAHLIEISGELFDVSRSLGVRVDIDVAPGLPEIRADEVQVRQVLMNLITNAAQAMSGQPDGRIVVSCQSCTGSREREVAHSWAAPDSAAMVCFVISDNGPGIDAEDLKRIFEPFFTTNGPGRGLGMPTVLGIVKAHGGAIAVDSKPGVGTVVEVSFPVATSDTALAEPPAAQGRERLDLEGRRVLLVDDQPEVREVASELIERLGATVRGAASGSEALGILAEDDAFDLAVVDVTMPGMSGLELASRIREDSATTGILLTSGYAAEQSDVSGSGFVFLRKPYRLAGLQDALREALDRQRP